MTTLTLLVYLESHSSSIKTPVKIPRKVLHILTTIVVMGVWGFVLDDIPLCQQCTCKVLWKRSPLTLLILDYEHLERYSTTKLDEVLSLVSKPCPDLQVSPRKWRNREDDVLREKLSKINLLIAKIEAMNSNPPPSSDFVTKSSSTSLNLFLEETNTFDNSLTESETFCFDLEENSSGSTTTLSDYSLPDYEAFYLDDDHIEEKSSGSTTTHADFSQYDSFIFDLSINPFPPADRRLL
ncbi:hypothetical protein Tco_0228765 [Tanacetum coccineum]